MKEDDLMSRVEMLENQLQVYAKVGCVLIPDDCKYFLHYKHTVGFVRS